MECPFCAHPETRVLESRAVDAALRRRRECLDCENRFTTYETVSLQLKVIKRDGREENFQVEKIRRCIEKVCRKEDTATILALTQQVEQKIWNQKVETITTREIGQCVLQELRKFDAAAYLRFAAVYRSVHNSKILETEVVA